MADIVNPYIAGNPVTGPEMFFGREDVFDFIRQTLVGKHQDHVIVLEGQRRTGKTSVLYQIHRILDTRYLCIITDLHGFALQGFDGFLWELANHIIRVLRRDYQIALPRPSHEEFVADPRSFFENEFLNQVLSAIGKQRVLLMLDEAIRLQEQVKAGKLEHEIFEYLRHLMQHNERLNFLFSLGSGLEEMETEYAFLFNVGLHKKISFLDRNTTRDLITRPVNDCYEVEPEAVDRIYDITSGYPYYTQLVCHCLFNCWVQQNTPRIGVRDVDEVLNEAVERGSAVLKHVWEDSTPAEKAILASMASTMSHFDDVADANDINRAWASCDVVIPKGEMAKAIRSLIIDREVIKGQDKYTFTVDLQRLWVKQYRRLEWVKEEIPDDIREWSSDLKASEPPAQLPLPPLPAQLPLPPLPAPPPSPPPPRRSFIKRLVLIVVLVLLLIVSCPIIGVVVLISLANQHNLQATATAVANQHNLQATATAVANQHNLQATATAQIEVITNPSVIAANPNPYTPGSGKLAVIDPLSDASKSYDWDVNSYSYGKCAFSGGTYHSSTSKTNFSNTCYAQATDFSNFAFEAQLKIVRGDCGGMLFRADSNTGKGYFFDVCQNGFYNFSRYLDFTGNNVKDLAGGTSTAIVKGLNQSNVIAVVVQGSMLTIYVNKNKVASAIDSTFSHGQIGLFSEENIHPSEVAFNNVRVWVL